MRLLHTADWHFGHSRTETRSTTTSLRKHLLPRIADVDLIVNAGDIFDNALSLTSAATYGAVAFFHELLLYIEEHKVPLLVLRGTTLHDRNQTQLIEALAKYKQKGRSWLYVVDTPKIIKIKNKSFLCLPDDLPFDSKESLFEHIDDMLLQMPDRKVDYVVLHGMFDFACQGADHTDSYTVNDFKDIVKEKVLCGHVHRPWQVENVFYAGSFDRLSHNEEHPKGYWIHTDDGSEFIENTDAVKYLTFEYNFDDLQEMCTYHDRVMEKNFKNVGYGYCRIIMSNTDLRQSFRKYHLSKYKHINLKFKRIKGATYLSDDEIEIGEQITLETPTLSNLPKIVCQHIDDPNVTINDIKEVIGRL